MTSEPRHFSDIDLHRLDEEWVRHVRDYHKAAERLAERKKDTLEAKARKEVVWADLAKRIRANPDIFNLKDKPTVDAVKEEIALQPDYQLALKELIQSEYEEDIATANIQTLNHKKTALEDLVRLRLADYYADPVAPQGSKEQVDKAVSDKAFGRKKTKV